MTSLNILLDVSVKSVLVLALVAAAMPFLQRGSAALRHFVWLLALTGLLALPALSLFLPGWHILPRWNYLEAKNSQTQTAKINGFITSYLPVRTPIAPRVPFKAITRSSFKRPTPIALAASIWLIWLGGMLLALSPLFLALASLRRLQRDAVLVADDAWLDLLEISSRRLALQRSVSLFKSDDRQMPMTWGLLSPRILLPEDAGAWPAQRRELTLLHELAHIKRGDCLFNYVSQIVCALYWFNPLVWMAARALRAEREQACDDLVLSAGSDPGDYAEELLGLAATLGSARFASVAASPMARRSTLEGRLLAILDQRRNRASLSPAKIAGAVALLAAILIPVSVLRASSAEAQETSNATASSTSKSGGQETISHSYTVDPGGTLLMDLEDGDIEISGADGNTVDISVKRAAKHASSSEAAEMLQDHEITFEQNGGNVTIRSKGPRAKNTIASWFGHHASLESHYHITTPRAYHLDLSTGGGNIRLEALDGKIECKTSGGNLELAKMGGPIVARTSGGDISATDCQASFEGESDGGNLRLDHLHGAVKARTGGGNVMAADCMGALNVKSGGGNFMIDKFTGPSLDAETGGGPIHAEFVNSPAQACSVESGGGDIYLTVPANFAVNLDASTGGGSVHCDFPVGGSDVSKETDHLKGPINGGGPALKASTGGGDVKISKR